MAVLWKTGTTKARVISAQSAIELTIFSPMVYILYGVSRLA
jgi:hypothetical protein